MADQDEIESNSTNNEVIEAEVVEETSEVPTADVFDEAIVDQSAEEAEVAVEEQAQQPPSEIVVEETEPEPKEESKPEVEVPPETPNPIPETTVNIEIPPIAEETGDIEGIERAKEELAQIHGGEEEPKEEPVVSNGQPTTEEVNVPKETPAGEIKPYTIRSEETGDKVYAVVNGKRYWIKNPETLKKLSFNLGGESNIPFAELLKFPEGKPADLTIPGAVNPWDEVEEEQPSADKSGVWN